MTAWVIFSPSLASASALSFWRIIAEISGGLYSLPLSTTRTSPLGALATLYGTTLSAFWTSTSSNLRPMKRLTLKMVFSGLVIACRRATWPTRRSPVLGLTATTEGVSRLPSAFSSTVGSPASITAATEFVVPRSIPSTLAIQPTSRSRHDTAQHHVSWALRRGHPPARRRALGTPRYLPVVWPNRSIGSRRNVLEIG